MAGLHFEITGDNSNLQRKLQDTERGVKSVSNTVAKEGENIEALFNRISKSVSAFGIGFTAKEFVTQVAQVRGEFQKLEVAFATMLGNKSKAEELMSQMVRTAATTPFSLQDVAGGAKQLLAFGVASEEVNQTLIRLGDIAAGLSIPLGDLVYLYGTTRAQGRLYTEDFNQFTSRGIPMVEELSKQFGVAESEVKKLVEAGKVGFPEVQKVIENLTSEGGKFGGLMEAQSKTIAGQISNIEDSISQMFNEIGQANEGIISDALGVVSSLVENYQTAGKVVLELVGVYGAYKVALMTITALQKVHSVVLSQAVVEQRLAAAAGIRLSESQAIAASRTKLLAVAQAALNKTIMANPYVLAASAVASLGYAIYKLSTYQTEAEKAQNRLNDAVSQVEDSVSKEVSILRNLDRRLAEAKEGSDEWVKIKEQIVKNYSKYLPGLDDEIEKTGSLAAKYDILTESIRKAAAARSFNNIMSQEDDKYNELRNKNLEKVYNSFIEELGDGKGLEIYRKWLSYLDSGDEIPYKIQKQFGEISTGYNSNANSLLFDIREQGRIRDEILKKYKDIFNITDNDILTESSNNNLDGNKIKEKLTNLSEIKKSIQETEKSIVSLRKEAASGKISTSKVDEKIKELDELKKKYKSMTGLEYGKNKKEAEQIKDNEEKLSEQLLSLQRKNQQEEVSLKDESREKKLAKINADFEAQKQAIEKQSKELAKLNKKAKINGLNKNGLTAEQQAEIDKANELNVESRKKVESDVYREEAEAMRDYLKEYGTYQEQKLAIAEEYAEKIRKAQSAGERMSLEKRMDSAIHQVDMNALSQKIDWGAAFGDLTGLLADQMKNLLGELKQYVKTDEFKKMGAADQQVVYDAIERIQSMLPGGNGTLDFSRLQTQMHALGDAVTRVQNAELQQEAAYANLEKAQENYEKAIKSGNEAEIQKRKLAIDMAKTGVNMANTEYSSASSELQNLGNGVKEASKDTIKGLNAVAAGLQGFASGTLSGAFAGIQNMLDGLAELNIGGNVGDAIGKMSETLSSAGVIGQIVSAILSILDVLKEGIGTIISSLIDTIFNAITGILDNILSGDLFKQIGGSLVKGIGGLLNTVSFGGFNKLFGIGEATKKAQLLIERLTNRNELLQTAIEGLTNEIKASKGTKSVSAYRDAVEYQKEQNRNYLEIARRNPDTALAFGFWERALNKDLKKRPDIVAKIFELTGANVTSADDFWELSPEQMASLRNNVGVWNHLMTRGDKMGSYVDEKLDDYISQAGKLEELTEQLYEGLTGISFDGMYSSFVDNLMDMKYGAAEAAEDISEYFTRAMLSNKIGELYSEKLKGWWNKFGKAMEDNDLSKTERDDLMKEYLQYVKDAEELRDNIFAATGYDKIQNKSAAQQEASRGFSTEMTHDDAGELSGRFTALYEVGLQILQNMSILQTISVSIGSCDTTLFEIRNLIISSNGHLEDISLFVKKILDGFGDKLDNININIKNGLQ